MVTEAYARGREAAFDYFDLPAEARTRRMRLNPYCPGSRQAEEFSQAWNDVIVELR